VNFRSQVPEPSALITPHMAVMCSEKQKDQYSIKKQFRKILLVEEMVQHKTQSKKVIRMQAVNMDLGQGADLKREIMLMRLLLPLI
jgi:hypothetical protein